VLLLARHPDYFVLHRGQVFLLQRDQLPSRLQLWDLLLKSHLRLDRPPSAPIQLLRPFCEFGESLKSDALSL
jgi:hypothetical protein